jgi:hypothetical protein
MVADAGGPEQRGGRERRYELQATREPDRRGFSNHFQL